MLVLSRRINEKIVFSDLGIEVKVVLIEGGKVRLGIEAPADVKVLRGELLDPVAPGTKRPARQLSYA